VGGENIKKQYYRAEEYADDFAFRKNIFEVFFHGRIFAESPIFTRVYANERRLNPLTRIKINVFDEKKMLTRENPV
jgi:hypothetical protein